MSFLYKLLLLSCIPLILYACKPSDKIIDNWMRAGSDTTNYTMGIDPNTSHQGSQTMSIKSREVITDEASFATLMNKKPAKEYSGKRIRLSGYLKTKNVDGWVGFFMRVDGDGKKVLAFDNMQDRPVKGSSAWKKYEIVLNVPQNASNIAYGTILSQNGEVWFDHITIEVVDTNIPVTKENPYTDTLKISKLITQNYLDSTKNLTTGNPQLNAPYLSLYYDLQRTDSIEWAYGEINVPKNEAPVNTYYCILGGNYFYSGIQVNSGTERRIIFSVWDAKGGNNDKNLVADSARATLLYACKDLYTDRFGGEGSGVHTHLIFDWKEGTTYKFLLNAQPDFKEKSTTYTFFVQTDNKWKMLAKIKTPYFSSYIKYLYSFLENFGRNDGMNRRSASYQNIWVNQVNGCWNEITRPSFHLPFGDNNRLKKDYGCGLSTANGFMLSSGGGFTDTYIPENSFIQRPATGIIPVLQMPDLNYLPTQ